MGGSLFQKSTLLGVSGTGGRAFIRDDQCLCVVPDCSERALIQGCAGRCRHAGRRRRRQRAHASDGRRGAAVEAAGLWPSHAGTRQCAAPTPASARPAAACPPHATPAEGSKLVAPPGSTAASLAAALPAPPPLPPAARLSTRHRAAKSSCHLAGGGGGAAAVVAATAAAAALVVVLVMVAEGGRKEYVHVFTFERP